MDDASRSSRRRVLKLAVIAAGAGLAASVRQPATAQQKASKEAMKYQDKPNGNMQCDGCSQFVAPDACKIVEGKISPQGYCIAWVKKA